MRKKSESVGPTPTTMEWTRHGDFIQVAISARTGFQYVVWHVPGGLSVAFCNVFRPDEALHPAYVTTSMVRWNVRDAKQLAAEYDGYEAPIEVREKARRKS